MEIITMTMNADDSALSIHSLGGSVCEWASEPVAVAASVCEYLCAFFCFTVSVSLYCIFFSAHMCVVVSGTIFVGFVIGDCTLTS